jgi:hypothetical protein
MAPLLFMLMAFAADAKAEPAKSKTAPLSDVHRLTLENMALRFELAKRQITELQTENQRVVAEVCKSAGFAKCKIDAETKLVTETKD